MLWFTRAGGVLYMGLFSYAPRVLGTHSQLGELRRPAKQPTQAKPFLDAKGSLTLELASLILVHTGNPHYTRSRHTTHKHVDSRILSKANARIPAECTPRAGG